MNGKTPEEKEQIAKLLLWELRKKNMRRKKKYYDAHPEEAVEDHIKQIKTDSDAFIMEKVEQWEKANEARMEQT